MTYSFKNDLKLTNNYMEFKNKVYKINLGSNKDKPEGGLDALSQVVACKNEIGWRNQSRKIIVFMTDGEYHAAGDGKWLGINTPHDGQCYMKDGQYTKGLDLDYPSVGLIKKLAADDEIIIIFAIVKSINVYKNYKSLSEVIKGSKHTYIESEHSTEIATILRNIYEVSNVTYCTNYFG